jgi:para-aminobenzoate synthetase component 1
MADTPIEKFIELMNKYGVEKEPFVFIVDFEMRHPEIHKLNSLPSGIKFSTPLFSNVKTDERYSNNVLLKKYPPSYSCYEKAFKNVMSNLRMGNSYLLNLTFPTQIETSSGLDEIFYSSIAKYKLLYHDRFVVFSPEIFVRISNGEIRSYPMKGTIDAKVPDAENVIVSDSKEMAEHSTIVDLIRNDLSKVADNVRVLRYRIRTENSELIQVSSEISGQLFKGYESKLGDILTGMLPAGSVTGAPKKETLRIIRESEECERGWYTGVFGVFDGESLDSGVMIRYIERIEDKLFFRSGGGITFMSEPLKEYEELISKIYVPVG